MATKNSTVTPGSGDHAAPESNADARARIARIERRMADSDALREAANLSPRETKKITYRTYGAALTAGRQVGAARADDNALMALFCAGPLQTLVGAVSPQLVWEGAQAKGLTTRQLGALANSDPMAVSDLQWVDPLSETAARYRLASAHCRDLAACADFDGCLAAQDEMAMCRCQLKAAGRLDLIGVSA